MPLDKFIGTFSTNAMAPPSRNGKIRCPTYPSTSNTSSYFHSTTISSAVNKISFRIFRIFSLFSSIQFLPLFNILSNPLFLSCSNPFQQLNNRQIQKCQSIYSHQLCHRQCLHFEHFLKCWIISTPVIKSQPSTNAPIR